MKIVAALLIGGALAAPLAAAQQAQSQSGEVISIDGPPGSVIVVRGAQAYALQPKDVLFDGDRLFTRSNGAVSFKVDDCEKTLGPAASIMIDDEVCQTPAATLAGNEVVNGVSVTANPATGRVVAATPALLLLLAGGGGAAAAALSSEEAEPVL